MVDRDSQLAVWNGIMDRDSIQGTVVTVSLNSLRGLLQDSSWSDLSTDYTPREHNQTQAANSNQLLEY